MVYARGVRRLVIVVALVGACSKGSSSSKPTSSVASSAASSAAPAVVVPSSAAQVFPKLNVQLRSVPSGASASVDGNPAGTTPALFPVDGDGKIHEFAFVLQGYEPQTIRFVPVRDLGVVTATLKPIAHPDAGR
jgi:hypothetical protein